MKLSIVIPVYNLENYISNSIESVVANCINYPFEIIVINDGSTDCSKEIIEELQKKYKMIQLINVENGGVSRARNIGIRESKGEYITFIDGDDTIEVACLQKMITEMENGNYDFVQVNFNTIENGKVSHFQFSSCDTEITEREKMMDAFLGNNKKIHNTVWGKIYRLSLIKEFTFDNSIRIAEDQKFVFEVLLKAKKIKLLSYCGYNYYIRNNSALHSFDVKKFYESIIVLDECFAALDYDYIKRNIRKTQLGILMDIYNKSLIYNQENSIIYNRISEIRSEEILLTLSKSKRFKVNMLVKARPIYNLLYRFYSLLKNKRMSVL